MVAAVSDGNSDELEAETPTFQCRSVREESRGVTIRIASCASCASSARTISSRGQDPSTRYVRYRLLRMRSKTPQAAAERWRAPRQTMTHVCTMPKLGLQISSPSLARSAEMLPWPRRHRLCGDSTTRSRFDETAIERPHLSHEERRDMSEDEAPLDWDETCAANPQQDSDGECESWHAGREDFHRGKNNYRCKSLINSKTISVSKKKTEIIFAELLNSKNNNVRMKLQTLQILHIFIECRIMVGGASVHISKHSPFRLKITVGCRLCTYPSIHVCMCMCRVVCCACVLKWLCVCV